MKEHVRIIISGGGTGGHIFPAISIANSLKEVLPEADILFVGAENKMEMEKVPAAGFDGDQADPRNFNAAQYETRVQGLVEAMETNASAKGK